MDDDDWKAFVESQAADALDAMAEPDWFVDNVPREWHGRIEVDGDEAVRAAAAVVGLVMPEWETRQPDDSMPVRALAAALQYLDEPSTNLKRHVATLAKGCTESRRRSLGYQHRIAEAVRSIARAAVSDDDDRRRDELGEALSKVEEHIRYRHACDGEYPPVTQIRRSMFAAYVAALGPSD